MILPNIARLRVEDELEKGCRVAAAVVMQGAGLFWSQWTAGLGVVFAVLQPFKSRLWCLQVLILRWSCNWLMRAYMSCCTAIAIRIDWGTRPTIPELPRSDFSGFDTDFYKGRPSYRSRVLERTLKVTISIFSIILGSRGLCFHWLDHNCLGGILLKESMVKKSWIEMRPGYASEQVGRGLCQSRCRLAACSSALRGKANHCGSRIGRSRLKHLPTQTHNTCLSFVAYGAPWARVKAHLAWPSQRRLHGKGQKKYTPPPSALARYRRVRTGDPRRDLPAKGERLPRRRSGMRCGRFSKMAVNRWIG